MELIAPSLQAYDHFLASHANVGYVGTRLHAGIRAMQAQKRSIILGIDHRALEKGKDFDLPVVPRCDLAGIEQKIDSAFATELRLPTSEIDRWCSQFSGLPELHMQRPAKINLRAKIRRFVKQQILRR